MNDATNLLKRAVLGAAGGLAGTLALQALMKAGQTWVPATVPPIREDPGRFMVEKAEHALPDWARERIPASAEKAAAQSLAAGYGVTFGALYALLRPGGGRPVRDGVVLGAACWAAGYLGWLPALGLLPPPWRQTAPQVAGPAAEHLAYGVATVATYDLLRQSV